MIPDEAVEAAGTELASYRKWADENPACCEYCLDQWLSNQDNAEKDIK